MAFTILSGTDLQRIRETAETREQARTVVRALLLAKRPNVEVYDAHGDPVKPADLGLQLDAKDEGFRPRVW